MDYRSKGRFFIWGHLFYMDNKKNKKKGIWIPEEIKVDKKLDWTNKALLTEIYSLCELPDGCIASDNHFGRLLGIGRTSVNKRVNKLEEMGYINTKNHFKGRMCIGRTIIKSSSFEKHTLVPKVSNGSSSGNEGVVPKVDKNSSIENTINTFTNSISLIQESIQYTGETKNTGISQAEYYRKRIIELESKLVEKYPQYTFLNKMANPDGIKELKHHIDNKNELDSITLILKELAQSKKYLTGKYD